MRPCRAEIRCVPHNRTKVIQNRFKFHSSSASKRSRITNRNNPPQISLVFSLHGVVQPSKPYVAPERLSAHQHCFTRRKETGELCYEDARFTLQNLQGIDLRAPWVRKGSKSRQDHNVPRTRIGCRSTRMRASRSRTCHSRSADTKRKGRPWSREMQRKHEVDATKLSQVSTPDRHFPSRRSVPPKRTSLCHWTHFCPSDDGSTAFPFFIGF